MKSRKLCTKRLIFQLTTLTLTLTSIFPASSAAATPHHIPHHPLSPHSDMASTVRYLLEESVPELQALVDGGIFTRDETRAIVARRQAFEYALKRRTPVLDDFIRYVNYEASLNKLRRHRVASSALASGENGFLPGSNSHEEHAAGVKKLLGGHTFLRRIHFIYQRALNKFRGNVELWMRYFAFCRAGPGHGGRILARALARALRLHPRIPGLWAYAASWEFDTRGNAVAARALMQRGLRINKASVELWAEYFKMECMYALKLRTRRDLLAAKLGNGLMGTGDGDGDGDGDGEDGDDGTNAQQAILDGSLAVAVINGACRAFPTDASPVLALRAVLDALPTKLPTVENALYAALGREYADDDTAAVACAIRSDDNATEGSEPHAFLSAVWALRPTVGTFDAASQHLHTAMASATTEAAREAAVERLVACYTDACTALKGASASAQRWSFAKPLAMLYLQCGDVSTACRTLAVEASALARTRFQSDVGILLLSLVASADAAGATDLVACALPSQPCDVGAWLKDNVAALIAPGSPAAVSTAIPALRCVLEWSVSMRRADIALAIFRLALSVHMRGGSDAVSIDPVLRLCSSVSRILDDAEGAVHSEEATRLREKARRRLQIM